MKTCTKCGAQNPDINNFCSSCGQKLEISVDPQPTKQTAYTAPVSSQPQTNSASQCQITFNRIKSVYGTFCKIHIKVDDSVSYELSNGGSVTVPMSLGKHSVEISVFANPVKTAFDFEATENMTFNCKTNGEAFLSPSANPVTVTDGNGKTY